MLLAILILVTCVSLISVLTIASFFISEAVNTSREESSTYECGFEHHSHSRVPFSIRYFMLTLIFLIFDMEIIFLLFVPGGYFVSVGSWFLTVSVSSFVFLLLLGLFYEWVDGSLDWVI